VSGLCSQQEAVEEAKEEEGPKTEYEPFELMVCDHAGPYPTQLGGLGTYRYGCVRVLVYVTFKMHNLTASATVENAEILRNYATNQTTHTCRRCARTGPDWTSHMLGK